MVLEVSVGAAVLVATTGEWGFLLLAGSFVGLSILSFRLMRRATAARRLPSSRNHDLP